ncbi:MAG TPA: hypothetical protein VK966_01145, partial [Longimicrobiales bacterium]|nr:hypothetical protein [Longimicrobiales bacterium]
MSRSWPVMKREFMEMARSKAYILGTVLGPILILSFFALPVLFIRAGAGGERMVLILDATGTGVGQEVAAGLNATALVDADRSMGAQFTAELVEVEGAAGPEREAARERVLSGEDLDGYLFLPSDFLIDGRALYEGRNATSMLQMQQIEGAATRAVRSHRLEEAEVDPAVMAAVLEPVSMDLRKPGSEDEEGGAETAFLLGTVMAMAVYFAVIMFAASVMRGVLEEKRNS